MSSLALTLKTAPGMTAAAAALDDKDDYAVCLDATVCVDDNMSEKLLFSSMVERHVAVCMLDEGLH